MALPFFVADFPGERKLRQLQPFEVIVRQKEYNHDVIVLRFQDPGVSRRVYRKGAPAVVRWGWAPRDIETFYGYVHSTKLVQPTDGVGATLDVYLISTSTRLNKTRMRSHKNLGVVPLIRRLAAEHRFTLRNDPSSRFHRHIPQLGRSDFRLMCELARDIGFTLHVKRTEVQFKRRVIDTNPRGSQPTFRYRNGIGPMQGTLFGFVLKAGSAPLAKQRRLVVGGTDARGKRFWATDPTGCCEQEQPSFTEYVADAPSSIHEGRELLSGLSRMNRFYVQAEVEVSGSAKLRCGQTLRLVDVAEEMAGYWWVGGVEHRLSGPFGGRPTSYRMKCEVGRETLVQEQCEDEEPPRSWAGKPVAEPEPEPEVATVYDPQDDCPPLEVAADVDPDRGVFDGGCHCPPKKCPGKHRPPPRKRLGQPRLDRWGAMAVPRRLPRLR